MRIRDRVELFKGCKALEPVSQLINEGHWEGDDFDRLEALRTLNTRLSELYQVSLPVITVWVRDNSYVAATGEIYLTEPDLEAFLHQYRHHLQNVERKYERRGLTSEGCVSGAFYNIAYRETVHKMYGEDDARAWAKFLIELATGR